MIQVPQMEYKDYEFCKDINCPSLKLCLQESDTLTVGCIKTAEEFHKWLKENGFKIIKGQGQDMGAFKNKIGDYVIFVDVDGVKHNALVIHAWETTLNIAYIHETDNDSYGHLIVRGTSVPYKQFEMLSFYIE